jgi:hypothetical protein
LPDPALEDAVHDEGEGLDLAVNDPGARHRIVGRLRQPRDGERQTRQGDQG